MCIIKLWINDKKHIIYKITTMTPSTKTRRQLLPVARLDQYTQVYPGGCSSLPKSGGFMRIPSLRGSPDNGLFIYFLPMKNMDDKMDDN